MHSDGFSPQGSPGIRRGKRPDCRKGDLCVSMRRLKAQSSFHVFHSRDNAPPPSSGKKDSLYGFRLLPREISYVAAPFHFEDILVSPLVSFRRQKYNPCLRFLTCAFACTRHGNSGRESCSVSSRSMKCLNYVLQRQAAVISDAKASGRIRSHFLSTHFFHEDS